MKYKPSRKDIIAGAFAVVALFAVITVFGQNPKLGPVSNVGQFMAQLIYSKSIYPTMVENSFVLPIVADNTIVSMSDVNNCHDGIDNDADGDIDADDYSCIDGNREDGFDKQLTPPAAVISWPIIPSFTNRRQCNSYCSTVKKVCLAGPESQRVAAQASCSTANGCRSGACAGIPGQSNLCNVSKCDVCMVREMQSIQPGFAKCENNFNSCMTQCRALFPSTPPSTTPGGSNTL